MNETNFPPQDVINIGPDKVWFEGETLVILARREMPDWTIREFQRIPIYFYEQKFFLSDKKTAEAPCAVRYELSPWPADAYEQSSLFITYDAEYVAQREGDFSDESVRSLVHKCLLPAYPFLGFLWSRFKDGLLSRCGFTPVEITGASVFLSFSFCFVEGIFVGWLRGGLLMVFFNSADLRWLDCSVLAVFTVDFIFRFNQMLSGKTHGLYGFLEWLWPWKKTDR